jgi:gliding motility-associated lipoprotein GldD
MRIIILWVCLSVFVFSCKEKAGAPKPHAFPRVYYPAKIYQVFDTNCPYSFQYPSYAKIENLYNIEKGWQPYWNNVNYLPFNATLHLSYKAFKNRTEFDSLFEDTRKLAYKHTIKADDIIEVDVFNPTTQTSGIIFDLKGNTATNLNFYISDGKKHFLRGALYFNSKTTTDSIAPVFQFVRQDVMKLIETTKWKD